MCGAEPLSWESATTWGRAANRLAHRRRTRRQHPILPTLFTACTARSSSQLPTRPSSAGMPSWCSASSAAACSTGRCSAGKTACSKRCTVWRQPAAPMPSACAAAQQCSSTSTTAAMLPRGSSASRSSKPSTSSRLLAAGWLRLLASGAAAVALFLLAAALPRLLGGTAAGAACCCCSSEAGWSACTRTNAWTSGCQAEGDAKPSCSRSAVQCARLLSARWASLARCWASASAQTLRQKSASQAGASCKHMHGVSCIASWQEWLGEDSSQGWQSWPVPREKRPT